MKAILIPVKLFAASKRRLAPCCTDEARAALAAALCEDFFSIVAQVRSADRIYIVSQEAFALDLARSRRWSVIVEAEQISESRSVDAASAICAAEGVTACLRLPIDIPLAEPDDIASLLDSAEPPPFSVLVPSRDGTGTNALLRSPPALFPSHFGPNSFARHVEEAERAGARVKIVHNPRIALDIDEPDDLRAVAGPVRRDSRLACWIVQHSVPLISGRDPFPAPV